MLLPAAKMPAKVVGKAPSKMVTSRLGWFGYPTAAGLTIDGEHAYLAYLNALYRLPQPWPTFLQWGGNSQDPVWLMLPDPSRPILRILELRCTHEIPSDRRPGMDPDHRHSERRLSYCDDLSRRVSSRRQAKGRCACETDSE